MDHNIWQTGLEYERQRSPYCLCTVIESVGSVPRRPGATMLVGGDGSTVGTIGGGKLERLVAREALQAIGEGKPRLRKFNLDDPEANETGAVCGGTVTIFFNVRQRGYVVHLFGAGHVARPVARVLAMIGCAVRVYDESPECASRERFPDAAEIIIADPVTSAAGIELGPSDAVIILTASHDTDFAIVRAFRNRLPAYLGVIGSKAKSAHYRRRLAEEGWPPSEIERIHSPIGLDIGARTPEEIAVSIAAEIIALRGPSE